MKKCIVNVFSEGREKYEELTKGLVKSIEDINFSGNVFLFSPLIKESSCEIIENKNLLYKISGWPKCNYYGQSKSHSEANHQFKAFAIQYAREEGYDQVMWCDSPVRIKKDPTKYFQLANELGVVTFGAEQGASEATWTSDICLASMNCDPEYAKTFNQCSSGVMIFDFTNKRGQKVFEDFAFYSLDTEVLNMKNGSSRPEFIAHRSDQSIISYVMKKHGMENLSWGGYMHKNSFLTKNPYSIIPTFINGD